jgi:hypothetical protein
MRRGRLALALVVGLGLGWLLVSVCADGGAMAGRQYDRSAADGPRRTICFGLVTSTTCYRSRGGDVVPCR